MRKKKPAERLVILLKLTKEIIERTKEVLTKINAAPWKTKTKEIEGLEVVLEIEDPGIKIFLNILIVGKNIF